MEKVRCRQCIEYAIIQDLKKNLTHVYVCKCIEFLQKDKYQLSSSGFVQHWELRKEVCGREGGYEQRAEEGGLILHRTPFCNV